MQPVARRAECPPRGRGPPAAGSVRRIHPVALEMCCGRSNLRNVVADVSATHRHRRRAASQQSLDPVLSSARLGTNGGVVRLDQLFRLQVAIERGSARKSAERQERSFHRIAGG